MRNLYQNLFIVLSAGTQIVIIAAKRKQYIHLTVFMTSLSTLAAGWIKYCRGKGFRIQNPSTSQAVYRPPGTLDYARLQMLFFGLTAASDLQS